MFYLLIPCIGNGKGMLSILQAQRGYLLQCHMHLPSQRHALLAAGLDGERGDPLCCKLNTLLLSCAAV